MNSIHQYSAILLASGVSLADLGLQEVALPRTDALLAVDALRSAGRAILGGDVYHRQNGSIVSAWANWSVEAKPLEGPVSYLQRSWDTAQHYLKAYPEHLGIEPLFSIVIDESDPDLILG